MDPYPGTGCLLCGVRFIIKFVSIYPVSKLEKQNEVFHRKMSDPIPGGSQGTSGDTDSQTDVIDLEAVAPGNAADNSPYQIGEATKNYDIRDSVAYSHNWFIQTEVEGLSHALCRLCEAEENSSVRTKPKRVKKTKLLKTTDGSTRGLFTHMKAHHEPQYIKMMEQQELILNLRREKAERKKGYNDKTVQLKLFSGNNNTLAVNQKLDPQLQSRWDAAVVDFVSESGVSFGACQKLDILLRAIWPTGRLKLKVRNAVTVSRHIDERSIQQKVDLYCRAPRPVPPT